MRIVNSVAIVLLTALASGACASAGKHAPRSVAVSDASTATVRVTNNNWSNVTVYMLYNGARVRLGDVTSMRTEIFRVPSMFVHAAGNVQLMADLLGSSDTYRTENFSVLPGQEVEFTVENQLTVSSLAIWNR